MMTFMFVLFQVFTNLDVQNAGIFLFERVLAVKIVNVKGQVLLRLLLGRVTPKLARQIFLGRLFLHLFLIFLKSMLLCHQSLMFEKVNIFVHTFLSFGNKLKHFSHLEGYV